MIKHHADESYFFARGSLFCLYVISSAFLALRVRSCVYHCADQHILALQISQCFVGMTVPISIYHAWEHITNFVRPRLQTQIVRIIWIVPIYSFECLLSISFMEHAFYFQAIREIYESYVIYCFMRFLLHFLGDGRNLVDRLALMPAHMGHHKAPFCWLQPWQVERAYHPHKYRNYLVTYLLYDSHIQFLQMGGDFLRNCKAGVFQFVIVKFLLAVLTLFLRIIGCYEEGNYNTNSSYLWITGICGASQSWAFYSLCLFYSCSYNDLVTMRPFMKFFCLKMVIFFCWWQGLAIGLLVKLGQINSAHGHSVQEVADLIQDLLISMEMLVAAIAFFNSFPIMEFANVRQFNWNPLSVTPLASSAVQPAMQSMESMGHSPKKSIFVPAVGTSMGSTAASSTPHDLTITSSGCSNSNSSNSSSNSSSGSSSSDALLAQSDPESEKSRLIIPEISTSIRSQSPVSDCGQSPSVYSSRKIFLPYNYPATKSDSKEQNVSIDKNGRAGVHLGKRTTVDSDADSGRATDFTSRLFALQGAGYELLRGVVPSLSFVPSSSFTISTNGNKKRQRHDSPPPNALSRAEGEVKEEVGRRGDSRGGLTDCRSDSNSPGYINRSASYSHDSTTPLLLSSPGGRHGDDTGGNSFMSQMGSKVKVLPHILAGLSPSPSSSQHASDSRGLPRGLKGAGAAVTLPSPVARRRAATTYQTGSINNSIININSNSNCNSSSSSSNARLANNALFEGHTSDDSHIDSTAGNTYHHSRPQGSSPTPLRHSPMSMINKEARSLPTHLTPHRGSGRKSVSPDIMDARKNFNNSNSCVRVREIALTDSQKANSNSNSNTDAVTVSAQSQPHLRSQSPARGATGKKEITSSSSSSSSSSSGSSPFQSIISPPSSSSSSSSSSGSSRSCPNPPCATKETHYNAGDHTIYHTLSQSREGAREYSMRDSTVREERDDLRNERGYFIGGSTSNSSSGLEGSGGSGLGGRMSNAALGQSHSHSHLQSPLQALVACTLPRELHEDIQELGVYVADSYITPPYAAMRKWVKGSAMS